MISDLPGKMSKKGGKLAGVGAPNPIFTYLVHPSKTSKRQRDSSRDMGSADNFHDNYFPSRNEHSNFVYVYFIFAYYLLMAPFRLQKVGHGKFEIYRWFPQQILCGFATALSVLRLGTSLRSSLEKLRTNDPISFFFMFSEASSFVFKMMTFKGFWTKAKAHLKLVNYMDNYYILPYNPYKLESTTTLVIIYGTYALISFLRLFFGSGYMHSWEWSPEWWYRRTVAEARYTFFLINGTSIGRAPSLQDITSMDTLLAIIHSISVLFRHLVGFYVDLFILIHIWTLWAPTSGFILSKYREISVISEMYDDQEPPYDIGAGSNRRVGLDTVIKEFDALKHLSILVEKAIGDVIMPFIGEALFYYAVYFDDALLTTDLLKRFVLMFFYSSAICIVVCSSEIVRKMRWLKSWLCEQGRLQLIDQNQLAMILDDLSNHSVGISASGIFTIDYSFVGTFITVLITYFIIRLQSASMAV